MARPMSQTARKEYLKTMRCRYQRYTGKTAKSRLLDEFCEVTQYERKYAIKLLKAQRGAESLRRLQTEKRGRKKIYSDEAVTVLFTIWRAAEQPCGKRLRPMLKDWIASYERKLGRDLSPELKAEVMTIIAAQIDRVLAPKKVGVSLRARRTPKANAAMKKLIPIRAECRDAKRPGWLEADTVAHCGGNMGGSFIWSLTATDIFSGWTEVRPGWNRFQHNVSRRSRESRLTFPSPFWEWTPAMAGSF